MALAAGAPRASHAQDLHLDPVVAVVDRQVITEGDLDYYVFERRLEDETYWGVPEEVLRARIAPSVVDEYLLYVALFDAAIEPDQKDLQAEVEETYALYRDVAGSDLLLRKYLDESGLKIGLVKDWLLRRAERNWYVRSGISSRVKMPPPNTINERPANARAVWIAQLVVEPTVPGNPVALQDARDRAARVRFEIAAGLAFDRAARVYSDDATTADRGGDLGWIATDRLDPRLFAAIADLQPGGVSEPVELDGRVMLLRLRDFETTERAAFSAAVAEERRKVLLEQYDRSDIVLSGGYQYPPPAERLAPRPAPEPTPTAAPTPTGTPAPTPEPAQSSDDPTTDATRSSTWNPGGPLRVRR